MIPTLVSDIVALPGWNTPMLLLLAKATLILIAALAITVFMQRGSAGARHLVWLVTLGTLLLVPALAAWSPLRLEILPERTPSVTAQANPISLPSEPSSKTVSQPSSSADAPAPSAGIAESTPTAGASGGLQLNGLSLFLSLWAAVALVLAGWLGYGALAVRRIVRNAHPLDTRDWMTPLWEVADRLELDEPPRLLGSNEAKMPFACGFLRPTIVLPADCESWSTERRSAVLLHELAHVKRRDLVGHTLGRIACAVYWFHPLVWTAAKQLRNESERACDDLALSCGALASDYAEHLLDIVTSVRHDSTPAVALAMARRKEFEGRMLAILDPELRHSGPSRRQSMALIASLALIAIVVGAAAPAPRPTREVAAALPAAAPPKVAAVTPPIDASFTPRDVPAPRDSHDIDDDDIPAEAISESIRESVKKSVDKSVAKSVAKSVVASTGAAIGESVGRVVSTAVSNAVSNAIGGGTGAKALLQIGVGVGAGQGKGVGDERPALLANILRTDGDPQLRRIAAWGLSEYAETQVALDALATALRRDSDAGVREMAAWSLGDGDESSTAVTALSAALRGDANENVRATAAWALGQVGSTDAVDALVAGLSDKSKRIRSRSVWAIGAIEPREAPRALLLMLRDPDPQVRELTAWALYQIEDPGAVPALQAALQSEQVKDLQIAYIRALAAVGEKSVDAIRTLLTSSDPKIKSIAVRALAGGNATGPWPWPWPEPRPYP